MSNRPWQERKQDYMNVMESARKAGIPHPEVIAAQWALESDWGRKASGKYNYWGVKSGNGDPNNNLPGTVSWTKENINGKEVRIKQKFRDYNSLDEALVDRAKFTSKKGGRYDKSGYFSASSPAEAAMALDRAGYATDPQYAQSLINVMKGIGVNPYNGQQYDYSTTKPSPTAQNTVPANLQPIAQAFSPPAVSSEVSQMASAFKPMQPEEQSSEPSNNLNSFVDQITKINSTLSPLDSLQPETETPKQSNRQKYQAQLAEAFGVQPETNNGLPDYISELVRSVYDGIA